MYKVIKKDQAQTRQIAENKIAVNYITKETTPDVSFAITEARDFEETEQCENNRIYFVLDGVMNLSFDDEKVSVNPEEACYIEKGTTYTMTGTFKAVVVNQPAFGALV